MNRQSLESLLNKVKSSEMSTDEALLKLKNLPYEDLGFAKMDHHRALRSGSFEMIYGEGKSIEHLEQICENLVENNCNVFITRLEKEKANGLSKKFPQFRYIPIPRIGRIDTCPVSIQTKGEIFILSAGTSDLPVCEEAFETLNALGINAIRLYDVGVAGIHRLLDKVTLLQEALAIIVVAGMEGALASVVAGLVSAPVIAVPTSVGYGTALNGLTPLFGMLTSCSSGIVVVNIDNGFGAAMAVHRITLSQHGKI